MPKRGPGPLIAAVLVAFVVLAAIASAATGRCPLLLHAFSTLASRVAALPPLSSAPSSVSTPSEAGSNVDAGAPVHRQVAPLSTAQLGAPLVHGTFVGQCGAPDDMKVVVHATVKMGRAVSVTVKTQPPNPVVASCIEKATRDLRWDVSPKVEHVTVTY
jgi:hypothetical protein